MLRYQLLSTHEHDFIKDLDGQVTCAICGAMDDEKELDDASNYLDFLAIKLLNIQHTIDLVLPDCD